ncbi:MAG TPA: NUDIX hydrolase [Candidatus Limnocylindria bacterium]|nr:NUDIX hydrolase [Candidatus Limnocylindria bacterium]
MSEPASVPLPSSTVVLLDDDVRGDGPFRLLMVKRHGRVTFPGVHAFPGGVVDASDAAAPGAALPADQRWAGAPAGDDPSTALPFWVAAVRELFEEVGLLLALRDGRLIDGPLGTDVLALRDRLHAGEGLAQALARIGAVPATHVLYGFARWITPSANPRRFDTRFLIGRAPAGQKPCPDGTETESCVWYTPEQALAAYFAGDIELIPPTVRTLDDLARFDSIDAVLDHARRRAVVPACPEIETAGGRITMRYPGAADDPVLPDRLLVLEHGRWRPLSG